MKSKGRIVMILSLILLGALFLSPKTRAQDEPASCLDILQNGASTGDGVYSIDPDGPSGQEPVSVYCDMTTDGGGWTLVGSTRDTTLNDQASAYYDDLATLEPADGHLGVWNGMRAVAASEFSDIRFSCRAEAYAGAFDVDLAFYEIQWYKEITASMDDGAVCFEEDRGAGQTLPPPARKNLLTGEAKPMNDQWNVGYLEGEGTCADAGDFTVDLDDRGMDSDQSDGTDWGEDDATPKCGRSGVSGGSWFIWVREPDAAFLDPPLVEGGGEAGSSVVYAERLVNHMAGVSGVFSLTLSGNAWPTTLPFSVTEPIAESDWLDFDIQVLVPPVASPGDFDVVTVRAVSALSPTVYSDVATLTTFALSGQYGYVLDPDQQEIKLVDTVLHIDTGRAIDTSPYAQARETWPLYGALSPDGQRLYVSLRDVDQVLVVDTATHAPVTSLAVGDQPHDIAFSGDGAYAFVAERGDDALSVIETVGPSVALTIPVGSAPGSIATIPCLDKIYVTQADDDSVGVISIGSLALVKEIAGLFEPRDIVASPYGHRVYVSTGGGVVGVIDTADDSLVATWDIGGDELTGLDISPDGKTLYVADDRASVTFAIDAFSGQVKALIPTGREGVWDVAVFPSSAGPWAYVSNQRDQQVTVLNIETNAVETFSLHGRPGGLALFPPDTACLPHNELILSPSPAARGGWSGATVVYTETLFNLTGVDDSFGLEITGNAWTTTLSISDTGLIADGGSTDFAIQVEIPPGLPPGASDEVVIKAIPLGTLDLYDTATLTTNVFRPGYVFDAGADTINVVDTVSHQSTGLLIDTSPYGGWPWRGALSPGGQWLYASLHANDQVLVVNAATHTPVTALDVGSGPHGIAFSADGAFAFVANQGFSPSDPGDDTVSVIDTAALTVTAVITVGDRPMSIGSSPYLDKVYVVNRNSSAVSVIDVDTLSLKDVITGLDYPWDIVISPLGERAYVSNQGSKEVPGAGSVGVIDTDDDVLIATWPIEGSVWIAGLDISPDSHKLYVADAGAGVTYVLDTSTGQVLAALPTGPHDDNSLEIEVFPAWAGPFAYVSNPFGGAVAVVNTDSGDVIGRIPMSDQPRGLALFAPSVVLGQAPIAVFTPTVSVRFVGQAVNFYNLSTGVPRPTYQWDFGDESPLSAAANPAHTYNITGTFTIVLTATNSFGQDTATGLVQVNPPPYKVYLPLLLRNAP